MIEYDGTAYSGSQRQPDRHVRTVQRDLEVALARLVPREPPPAVVFAGRTDAGVHALGNVVHVDLTRRDKHGAILPPFDESVLLNAVNMHLANGPAQPTRCGVVSARRVANGFHARFSASLRTYVYLISCGPSSAGPRPSHRPSPAPTSAGVLRGSCCYALLRRGWISMFDDHRLLHVPGTLDVDTMRAAAQLFVGSHDFSAFRSSQCEALSAKRRVEACDVVEEPLPLLQRYQPECERRIALRLRARSFLHHQVRHMTAALLEVGSGRMSPTQLEALLASRDVRQAPAPAPPHGLYLATVDYPEEAHDRRSDAGAWGRM